MENGQASQPRTGIVFAPASRVALVFIGTYFGYLALIGLGLFSVVSLYQFAMVWPASGFAAAMLYAGAKRDRVAVLSAVFLAAATSKLLLEHEAIVVVVLFAVCSLVAPVAFASLLARAVPSGEFTQRSESLFALLAAALGAAMLSGLIGAAALSLVYGLDFMDRLIRWTMAEAVGIGAFAPIALHLRYMGVEHISRSRRLEGGVYVTSLVALVTAIFSIGVFEPVFTFATATWLALPLLLLATGRGSNLHGAFGLFATTVVGVGFLVSRVGAFSLDVYEMRGEVVLFQVFVLSALCCMAVVGVYERDRLRREVERSEKAVLESVTDLVLSVHPGDAFVSFANRRVRAILAKHSLDGVLVQERAGLIRVCDPGLLKAIKETFVKGAPGKAEFRSHRLGRHYEADLYPSPDGVTVYARDVTDERAAREQVDLIAREMNHRVQNFFAIASSIVARSANGAVTPDEVVTKARGRIDALAAAYSASRQAGIVGALNVANLVRIVLEPYRDADRVSVAGPAATMSVEAATPFGLVLHELATNAVKYGALSDLDGRLDVSWSVSGATVSMTWRETASHPIAKPGRAGFGSRMIQTAMQQMNGTSRYEWRDDGLTVFLSMPCVPDLNHRTA